MDYYLNIGIALNKEVDRLSLNIHSTEQRLRNYRIKFSHFFYNMGRRLVRHIKNMYVYILYLLLYKLASYSRARHIVK